MTAHRRPGRKLEQEHHYVYILRDHQHEVVYVGRTSQPDTRPHNPARRAWIKTEVDKSLTAISPPMSFRAASWVEHRLIQAHAPKRNKQVGQTEFPADEDWRIDRLCEAEGVDRATAQWALKYYPEDPTEFEEYLAARIEGVAALNAEATERGVSPERVAVERVGEALLPDGWPPKETAAKSA